jgi:hypothetical protein
MPIIMDIMKAVGKPGESNFLPARPSRRDDG